MRIVAVAAAPRAALTEDDGGQVIRVVARAEGLEPAYSQVACRNVSLHGATGDGSRKKRRSKCSPFFPALNEATGR